MGEHVLVICVLHARLMVMAAKVACVRWMHALQIHSFIWTAPTRPQQQQQQSQRAHQIMRQPCMPRIVCFCPRT
jgi:hypothetical protein